MKENTQDGLVTEKIIILRRRHRNKSGAKEGRKKRIQPN